ncbi:dihydrolipoamide acetyltransferase family protein [Croceicoccus hydrothermalis]|uniref:dihydrolipoamide acetyltransferase family protein n=1 Tax=Croceicoccus hydrothermalis TaxID=2867964 RepID=UPI001EFB20D5|nr:dihydrolipoamide acetyltransferase family protein [Croceicoccus hydrothermalis]
MGRYKFRLPDIGEGVAEAEIVEWHVKPGDEIAEDDPLCDVMTDKATVDMTTPVGGRILSISGEVGEMKAVGSVLVEMEIEGAGNADDDAPAETDAGDDVPQAGDPAPEPAPKAPAQAPKPNPAPAPAPTPAPRAKVTPAPTSSSGKPNFALAAPATRRRAAKLGLDLAKVPGTGRNGRVTPDDIENYLGSGGDSRYTVRDAVEEKKIIGLRRKIADRMAEAKRNIPHITYVEEFDLTELEKLRAAMNEDREEGQPKLTILPFFVRALVRVLPDFPQVNAHFDDANGMLQQYGAVHVGIATATPNGLMVPVVRNAETLTVWESAEAIARLSTAARDGTAGREELSGSTITITSLGPLGGITTTPIINRPEVAIIGPNKLVDRPVVEGSFMTVRKIMNVSCGFDHRIIDGYEAALFVQRMKRLLEHPALIFMD